MTATIEAIMRHMVPSAKREPVRKQNGSNELFHRRKKKLRVVFASSQLTPSTQEGVN
jgi:hypothetical protein